MSAAAPLVALTRVSFFHPLPGGGRRAALREISLAVRPGERVVVLGANGAGKSTLAALLAGVLQPGSGAVERAERRSGPPALAAGLVAQNPEDTFTCPLVREEMGVVLENLDRDPEQAVRAVEAMLAEVGLAGHAAAHPAHLSGGQKQLLAVASVLIADPPLLLLDEQGTLLDPRGRAEVDALLERRGAEGGRAVVFFTAEVDEASRAERVVVLCDGAIVWEGPPEQLPLDGGTLSSWGLLPPDLALLGVGLREAGFPVRPPFRDPEALAEALCPSA